MKKTLLILIFLLMKLTTLAHIDIEVKELSLSRTPNNELTHTIKITLTNNSQVSKIVSLRNDYRITGYNTKNILFPSPLTLLGELAGAMDYSDNLLPLTIFADWFKIIKPAEKFIFYFQKNSEIDVDGIVKLIRSQDFSPLPHSEKLDWKDDEIIITLPDIAQLHD